MTLLFHWAPTRRRWPIRRHGVRPGELSTDRLWRPPHTCWAASPSLAWALSGATSRGERVESWDLWMTHRPGDAVDHEQEVRISRPVVDVWLVGTRTAEHAA